MATLSHTILSQAHEQVTLTPAQQTVVSALADGATVTAAASQAGVHRTTIHHWLRTSHDFALALQQARAARADLWQDNLTTLAPAALDTLKSLLSDPAAPASVRLRAAQTILNAVRAQPLNQADSEHELALALESVLTRHGHSTPPAIQHLSSLLDEKEAPVQHNSTQNTSVVPFRRAAPKVGRNQPCPCGSQRKHKHCCAA